ncbi:MAG TPA: hypothetical protein ACN46Q_07105, partial [Prochlorococcus sp.]
CQPRPKGRAQLAAGIVPDFKLVPRLNKDLKAEKPNKAMGQETMQPACQQISRPARGSRHRLSL